MSLVKQSEVQKAIDAVKNGDIIAFPTETVYGLGVIYDDQDAYGKLVAAKRRPPLKPFTLMLDDSKEISKYAEIDFAAEKLIKKYIPGQFTLILKAKPGLPSWAISKDGNVGVRVPDDDFLRAMIKKIGKPLLVPSANRSGEEPGLTGEEVQNIFHDEVAVIIDGRSVGTVPSTVVMLENGWVHVLREGNIKETEIIETIRSK